MNQRAATPSRARALTGGTLALALALAAGPARAGRDPVGRVVFARGDALWLTDLAGKAPAAIIAKLPGPASDVRMIRTDAAGATLLVDIGGRWYWAAMPKAGAATTLTALPCAPGAARLTRDGRCVLCSDGHGQAWLMRLADGRGGPRDVPAATATFVERDGVRALVWADRAGAPVQMSPVARRAPATMAPAAPLRGLLAAPDGSRAVGVYRAPAVGQPPVPGERDQLFGFALDGIGARRRLIRDGVVLDWSWDSRWLLIQDHASACIARAVGGEYKCWKNFAAVSVAPDGAYALLLGPRDGAAPAPPTDGDDGAGGEGGEGGEGEATDDDDDDEADGEAEVAPPRPKGPLSLYRATLAGPYSAPPAVIEREIDGAAVLLPP